jgi:flagellar basal-body rod protein FlgG
MSVGKNLYQATPASRTAEAGTAGSEGFGTVMQGFLEMSNVNVVNEMINLIIAQRAYEVNSKVIQATDDMLNVANNVKR